MKDCNCKVMPGFEQYQSKAEQLKQSVDSLGVYNPAAFNPSNQEVSLKDRLASKLEPFQEKEYGLAPLTAPQTDVPFLMAKAKRKVK